MCKNKKVIFNKADIIESYEKINQKIRMILTWMFFKIEASIEELVNFIVGKTHFGYLIPVAAPSSLN